MLTTIRRYSFFLTALILVAITPTAQASTHGGFDTSGSATMPFAINGGDEVMNLQADGLHFDSGKVITGLNYLTTNGITVNSTWGTSDQVVIDGNQVWNSNGALYLNYNSNTSVVVGGANGTTENLLVPTGKVEVSGEVVSNLTGTANIRMIGGGYGAFWRNDGSNTYFLLTNVNDQHGGWNGLRPIYINDSTGMVNFSQGITLTSGGITFPDGTVQTTAAGASSTTTTWSGNACGAGGASDAWCPGGSIVVGCGYQITSGWSGKGASAPGGLYASGNGCHIWSGSQWANCWQAQAICLKK